MIPHLLEEASDELRALVSRPRVLIALDFDGTLSPIAPTPEEAVIDPAAAAALREIATRRAAGLSLAVVSGRSVTSLRSRIPRVDFLVGLHGLEVQEGADPPRVRLDTSGSDAALKRLRVRLGPLPEAGPRLEDKGHALALHVRGLPKPEVRLWIERFTTAADAERAAGAPVEWIRGKAVVEARPLGSGKHGAISEILRRLGDPALLFVGDDATDEEVFAAFPAALTVAVMDPPRESAARTFLRSPTEVAAMLRRFAELRSR